MLHAARLSLSFRVSTQSHGLCRWIILKIFLSSTFSDLIPDREAVLEALQREKRSVLAMEYFLATAATPLETALRDVRNSDLAILVVGFRAGSLLPGNPDMTYTSAEYREVMKLGKHVLPFVKVAKKWPWSTRKEWHNREKSRQKVQALNDFRAEVGRDWTWEIFSNPSELALAVIQSIHKWESQGRPGARKTFSSTKEFFPVKRPADTAILDFSTSLFGRDKEMQALRSFLKDDSKSVCVVAGRGGIGKTKLVHDLTTTNRETEFLFLKDEPHWHEDSQKEIPVAATALVVDDAHRSESIGRVIQLFNDLRRSRPLKMILSTRPGGLPIIKQILYRDRGVEPSDALFLPELQELNKDEAEALAREVLGQDFSTYAEPLAQIAGNTPLVIVAGGRLISTEQISPGDLSNLQDFRSTIFNRFLSELRLEGPAFPISPTRPLLDLLAALGPIDVGQEAFLNGAEKLLGRRRDEILSTIDTLASIGIITRMGTPIRILPDVLSDFILEERCVGAAMVSTGFADQVFTTFGRDFLRNLMRNLSELDWRLERAGYGLDLLTNIWRQIESDFTAADEYGRHTILEELSSGAVYQPDHILRLVDIALRNPITEASGQKSRYRLGQSHVVEALPPLLEATAQHPEHLQRSVDRLWEIVRGSHSSAAKSTLERLTAYHLSGYVFFNFAMLLQAIRLTQRPDAFSADFTPFDLIDKLLEREGEFTEHDGNTVTFGGFGLNIAAVAPLRQNGLDFLEHSLYSDKEIVAVRAARSLGGICPAYLNRVGRQSADAEVEWQNKERLRALEILGTRLSEPTPAILRAQIYDEIRSATAINCLPPVQEAAAAALEKLVRDPELIILDATCRGDTDLPLLETGFNAGTWDRQIRALMDEAHGVLLGVGDAESRAAMMVGSVKAALACKLRTSGFFRLVAAFSSDSTFLCILADNLLRDPRSEDLAQELSIVLNVLHGSAPTEFHARATRILSSGDIAHVRAAAGALRVYGNNAIGADIVIVERYLLFPDPWVKHLALQAIAYMGDNVHLQPDLLRAALSVDVAGDSQVATSLVEAFGPYGVQRSLLGPSEVTQLLGKFLDVEEFDTHQGEIPRFLSELAATFPEQVTHFLLSRIERQRQGDSWRYRALGHVYGHVSFGSVSVSERHKLAHMVFQAHLHSTDQDEEKDYSQLFWNIAGTDDSVLSILVDAASNNDIRTLQVVSELIRRSTIRLAFDKRDVTASLMATANSSGKQQLINALVQNAHRFPTAPFVGSHDDFMENHTADVKAQIESFLGGPELDELAIALRRSIRQ